MKNFFIMVEALDACIYPSTRVIIDCAEIFIEKSRNPDTQSLTWSSYKNQNTMQDNKITTCNTGKGFVQDKLPITKNAEPKFVTDKQLTTSNTQTKFVQDKQPMT